MEHNLKITAEIDRMTGGRSLEISNSNSVEWNRLKRLAEDVLERKRTPDDPEIIAVKTQYGSRDPESTDD